MSNNQYATVCGRNKKHHAQLKKQGREQRVDRYNTTGMMDGWTRLHVLPVLGTKHVREEMPDITLSRRDKLGLLLDPQGSKMNSDPL